MEHQFTPIIRGIAEKRFPGHGNALFDASTLLQYLNEKTRSASRGSKARSSFANHYALYVLIEDYVKKGYARSGRYCDYKGAQFSALFRRQRQLPFGSKLQNHALNNRLNEEFHKFFPTSAILPILRDARTNRYWINENLLRVTVNGKDFNIARCVVEIIDAYIEAKKTAFAKFMRDCEHLQAIGTEKSARVLAFVTNLLTPSVDARIFEIVSFAILKSYYGDKLVYWGWTLDDLNEECLTLYKTGRTNANDGGIDFVMKPLGRFFQVTETTDVHKYFLDIEKVQRYPITFVIKSTDTVAALMADMRARAMRTYSVKKIVNRYMTSIEEIINIPGLTDRLQETASNGKLGDVMAEIAQQSKIEFNYEEA